VWNRFILKGEVNLAVRSNYDHVEGSTWIGWDVGVGLVITL
jgi:hypothetical protein